MVSAKLRENRLRIGWDISEKRVKMIIKMHRDLWKRIIYSRFVAIATVLAFLSFFVWRLLTSESDVKSLQTVKIGCLTFPSKRGVSEKQSSLVHFQLGIISYKKKKKKKYILGLCRCSVGNYSLIPGDHFQRSGDVETVLLQCIKLITFWILDQTSPNLQGSRRNGCAWCVQNYM